MSGHRWFGVDCPENGSNPGGQPNPRLLMSPVRTTRSASGPPTVRSYARAQSCAWFPVAATGTIGGPLGTGGGLSAVSDVGISVLVAAEPTFGTEAGEEGVDAPPALAGAPSEPPACPCPRALAAAAIAARSLFVPSTEPLLGFCPVAESPASFWLRFCSAS